MQKILVKYEVSEELLDTVYAELQDLLDNGDDNIRVTAYQTYSIDETTKDTTGTTIIIHLKDDEEELKYSDYSKNYNEF